MVNRKVFASVSALTLVGALLVQACSGTDSPSSPESDTDSGSKAKKTGGTDDSPTQTSQKDGSSSAADDAGGTCPEVIQEADIGYYPPVAKSTACTSKVLNAVVAALVDDAGYSAVQAAAKAGAYGGPDAGAAADSGAGATADCLACLFANYRTTKEYAPIMVYGTDTEYFVNYSNCYAYATGSNLQCAEILEKNDDCASVACSSCEDDATYEACVENQNSDENGICAKVVYSQVETKCPDADAIVAQCRADELDASNDALVANEYRKVIGTACGGL